MIDLQTVALWFIRISTISGVVIFGGAATYAFLTSKQNVTQRVVSNINKATYTFDIKRHTFKYWRHAVPFFVILWAQSEVRRVRVSNELTKIKSQAIQDIQDISSAYENDVPANKTMPNKQGYVYVGLCEKNQWIPKTYLFGNLPRNCNDEIPSDGRIIISWKGAIIRETPRVNVDGKPRFGAEVSRISAGHSVTLHKLFPTNVLASGPKYYWGVVDLPKDMPTER